MVEDLSGRRNNDSRLDADDGEIVQTEQAKERKQIREFEMNLGGK